MFYILNLTNILVVHLVVPTKKVQTEKKVKK